MIMAGGKGERLHPLTRDRSKPAVPFAGRYRIVDFVLSNFVNSDMLSLYVLVQYKSQSLIEHVRLAWRTTGIVPDYFVTVVPPQMRFGPAWYRGTADAVLQNLNLIDDFNPDVVAIFGADHIYRMDVNQMLAFHEETGADLTVAARSVPRVAALRPRQPMLAGAHGIASGTAGALHRQRRRQRSRRRSVAREARHDSQLDPRSLRVGQRGRHDRGLDRHGPHHGRQGRAAAPRHRRPFQHHPRGQRDRRGSGARSPAAFRRSLRARGRAARRPAGIPVGARGVLAGGQRRVVGPLCRHPRALLSAAARESVARDRRGAGLGSAVP